MRVGTPPVQSASTVTSPRARRPLHRAARPSRPAAPGSTSTTPRVALHAASPRPRPWRRSCRRSGTAGGCPTGCPAWTDLSSSDSIRCAWLPSSSRAQKLIFQALLQPVPPSPRARSDVRAAATSSGFVARADLPAGVQGEQVRHVPVVRCSGRPGPPSTPAAGPTTRPAAPGPAGPAWTATCGRERRLSPSARAAVSGVGEQVPDDLLGHRRARGERRPAPGRSSG